MKAPKNKALTPAVGRAIDKKFGKSRAESMRLFLRQFYASSPSMELQRASVDEILDPVLQAWKFVQDRPARAPQIKFIEYTHTGHGNHHTGTCILILFDDMPFLVDSIRQGLNRAGAHIKRVRNSVIYARRAGRSEARPGRLQHIAARKDQEFKAEALICVNCAHIDTHQERHLRKEIKDILRHVASAVKDYSAMCERALGVRDALLANRDLLSKPRLNLMESCEFISWLVDNHFTFLGYEQYRISRSRQELVIELEAQSTLGVSRLKTTLVPRMKFSELPQGTGELILKRQICNFAKSGVRSKIHRPVYCDYVLLKEFDASGNVRIEHRFLGLYTSSVYYRTALEIPLVRQKVNQVLSQSGFSPNGHSIKDLLQVINAFPRDELFQISKEQLFNTAIEITQIQETRVSRLFVRKDSYGKFFSCLVYLPRDIYSTEIRIKLQNFLQSNLKAAEIDFDTYFSESSLARIHFVLRVPDIHQVSYSVDDLESRMVEEIKPWDDRFLEALNDRLPEKQAIERYERHGQCFSATYKEAYSGETAVLDTQYIEQVAGSGQLAVTLSESATEPGAEFSFKIFSYRYQLSLSDVVPVLENFGLNIISEKTFELNIGGECAVWLHEFSLYQSSAVSKIHGNIKANFEAAFLAIWQRDVDDDGFNALVISAGLTVREAALLRAYAAYLKQIQFNYSDQFIAETLANHVKICRLLIQFFYARLDPGLAIEAAVNTARLQKRLLGALDAVTNLAEDSVLRAYINLVASTLRTNYFQRDAGADHKKYFSFKFDAARVEGLPRPKPQFEIFVFSREMEGVHLRSGKVARGGLRWSDRSEDYRTEILGLVKAQQVKNSVIVPVGAKGGFVVRKPIPDQAGDLALNLGIECYQTFIRGMLDITDNLHRGKVLEPDDVVRHDEDDPYLVVAADKGTAAFSDIANAIAADYGFWLGDGFASGGSRGYDHKQMGITAKGAWISVQRHFREFGIDVQKQDFTVIGIGDMSGDVFGNGMLRSRHICLLAAFNHRHIFVDPNPQSASSYRERARLFRQPQSSWSDYNVTKISVGGGVFSRAAKSIPISSQMRLRFDIAEKTLTPNQLISRLLRSPVDLIWNGGIGTYVKASSESHGDVGDKANDSLRVDARDLRCRVIGEGGNLGLSQLARIEYGLAGGVSLTDFIDNSAGVDCSDHEVNIKILLSKVQVSQKLTDKRRNHLLQSMTDEVAALVLANNYNQVQVIAVAQSQMAVRNKEFADLISYLENVAGLDRALEYLPDEERLEERTARQQYLTRPEISVLTSYMKMFLKAELVQAPYIDDHYLLDYLYSAFPARLVKLYPSEIQQHPLRKEIIATQLANRLVNTLGPGFVYRMVDSTGANPAEVVRAAVVAMEIFGIQSYWRQIEALDYKTPTLIQSEMMLKLARLMRQVTRWLLRNRRGSLDFQRTIKEFAVELVNARDLLAKKLPPQSLSMYKQRRHQLVKENVPKQLAAEIALCDYLSPLNSLIEISASSGEKLDCVMEIYYAIGEELHLNSLGESINQLPVKNRWQALARVSFIDDLSWQQRALTFNLVCAMQKPCSAQTAVTDWVVAHGEEISRTRAILTRLRAEPRPGYAMFSVVLRELLNLAQSTSYKQ
ncbi:MAG: NAD-glutamate dehydrogenase [Proteobacteria bacterium]|nr:NAD-glutamate dehydrogenase [Pseudomonadota bacterium]